MADKVIRIKVDKTGAQRALEQINSTLGKVGLKVESVKAGTDAANGSFGNMIPMAARAATGVGVVGAALTAAGAASIAFARSQAMAIKELEKSARMAGLSTQAFQAYAFAANSVGISQEKFGDILKDVNDKVGDFITTGGGEFKDTFEAFLKPIGVTTEQLKEMSSVEVLGALQSGLEQLGSNGQQATFALESIANDASLLQPLLENNAATLNKLANDAREMGLIVTPEQTKAAKEFNAAFNVTASKVEGFGKMLFSEVAPVLTELVTLAGNFATKMAEAFNLTMGSKISSITEEIEELQAAIDDRNARSAKKFGDVSVLDALNPFSADTGDTSQMQKKLNSLIASRDKMLQQQKEMDNLSQNKSAEGVNLGNSGLAFVGMAGNSGSAPIDDGKEQAKFDAKVKRLDIWLETVASYNLSEMELNDQWREQELTKLEEWRALNLEKEEEYNKAFFDINQKWASKNAGIDAKSEADAQKKRDKQAKDEQAALTAGFEAFNAIADATEGRSDKLNALVKGAAVFQATANTWLAASQALALPGDVSLPQKMASYASVLSAGMGIVGSLNGLTASRQSGGYMMGGTPYQVGGGAHTKDPELYQSGGKSYLVDSQSGTMKRVSGNTSAGGGSVNIAVNNMGEPMNATVRDNGLDENGVRQMIVEMTPQIMASEMGNRDSAANQSRRRWEKPTESYS